jgi:hypothetical protein
MPTKFYLLTTEEIAELFRQDPSTAKDGGFQAFIVALQKQTIRATSEIKLDEDDLERIRKYAGDSKHGGFQKRILDIFGRLLNDLDNQPG